MWLVLLAAALSIAAWLADLKASRIPIREERPADIERYLDQQTGGISRLLDR